MRARLIRMARRLPGLGRSFGHSDHLRTSTRYEDVGAPGPLVTEVLERLDGVPGWFNVDDCAHFFLVMSLQSAMGVRGDLFEIGSYHGRSTALMAGCLRPGEKVTVCDAFESETEDAYGDKPSPEKLMANLRRTCPDLGADQVVIHHCLSNDLDLGAASFRFVHVDGGHSADQTYFDLSLSSRHLIPNGVIALDDYDHRRWRGVTEGADRFLRDHQEFSVLADLNRHGAHGRKLYLFKGG